MSQQIAAIILAAGRGARAGGGLPKQWRLLAGRPVVAHSLAAFRAAGIKRMVLVIHPDDRDRAQAVCDVDVACVEGGSDRGASVRAALEALAANAPPQKVLIHDGARPLVSRDLIAGVLAGLETSHAAAPGLAVIDALWQGAQGRVVASVPRAGLFRAQTPQGFDFETILQAHRAHAGGAADDVEIAASAGLGVAITRGSEDNFKLTYPADFDRAEKVLSQKQADQMDFRIGNGFDVHRFGPGEGCWLCGVLVAHDRGLQGHSDADVGMHALTDAIYGALAEGDIGRHFPPSEAQWKGAASDIFLRHACARMTARGYRIGNCDVTLVCERPKIGPYAVAMQHCLAGIMGCDTDRISVKATTSERLGFTGREEGIAALATVSLLRA